MKHVYVHCVVYYCSAVLAVGCVWISWCSTWYRIEICFKALCAKLYGVDLERILDLLQIVIYMASSIDNFQPTDVSSIIPVIHIACRTHHSLLNLINLDQVKCTKCGAPSHRVVSRFLLN